MIRVDTEVEVSPPVSRSVDRAISNAAGSASYKVDYDVTGTDIIRNLMVFMQGIYHKTAQQAIEKYLGTDESKYVIEVDGVAGAPITSARVGGSGIIASPLGDVKALKKAFNAAIAFLHTVVPKKFKTTTGYYQTSARTAKGGYFTIRVNGKEVSDISAATLTSKSNIQIYSKARYAAPLEIIHEAGILLGARNAAKRAGGLDSVRASLTYRNPIKMGQVADKGAKGQTFAPLAVPVLEIGVFGSNVTDYVGNRGHNIQRGRKLKHKNLIERRILPEARELPRSPRKRPPGAR